MDNRLLSELQNGDDRQRRAASYRLGKSRDPDVVPYLIKAYNDPDPAVRRNVIDGLRQMATLGIYEASCFLDSDETDRQKIVKHVQQTGSAVPIEESVSHSPLPEPSPESIEHFERALEMWNEVPKSEWTDNLKLDIASELALAIGKAGAPFPRAHTLIGMLFNELGDDKRAGHHANIALQQDPNEFYAQLVRIDVELKEVRIVNLGAGDFVALGGTLEDAVFSSIGKSIGSLVAASHAGITQASFESEVDRLALIFKNLCKIGIEVDEYLDMADTLINLGDFARSLPFSGGQLDLYATVANTSVDKLDLIGREQDVADVRRKAEGRLLLFKS